MRKRKPFLLTLLVFLVCGCSVNDLTIFESKKIENNQENTGENNGNTSENEGKHDEQKPSFSYKINDETTGSFDAVTNSILNHFSDNPTVLEAYAFELSETAANVTFKLFRNDEEAPLKPTGASGNNAAYASDNQTIIFKEAALRSTIQLFKYANKVPYYINAQFEPVPETSKCPGCGAEGIVHSKCEHCDGYVCVGNHNARPCGEHYYCETDNLDHTLCEYCNKYHCNGDDHTLLQCGQHTHCQHDNLNHNPCPDGDGYLCDGANHNHIHYGVITFAANGGTGEMDPVNIPLGDDYEIPECGFSYVNHSFIGWKKGEEEELIQPHEHITVQGDILLTAQWEQNETPPQFYCPGCGEIGIIHSKCSHCDGYVCVGNHDKRPCGDHYYCVADSLDHTICEYCNTYRCNGKDHSLKPCGHPNCVIDNLDHSACLHCDGYLCDGNNHSLQQCEQHHHCENDNLSHSICPHCNEYLCNGANHTLRPCGLHYYCEQDSLDHSLCEYCNCYLCDGEDHTLFECGQHAHCQHDNLNHTQCPECNGYYCNGESHEHYIYATITFDPNGGDGVAYSTWCWAPAELTLPSNSFIKENHQFTGWKKDGDSTIYQPGDVVTIVETTTFYAQWQFTGHSYCHGCGAEDVEHDICIYCFHYVCNGENHNECPICNGHYCDGGNHTARPCGHYYCVWDMMDHDICGYCGNYLCQGDHSNCGLPPEDPPENGKYCPFCKEMVDPHPYCQYCGKPICIGDHSNCPPEKEKFTGVSGTFSVLYEFYFQYYWPNYNPYVPGDITGWGHAYIDYSILWNLTINGDGNGSLKGYMGDLLMLECDFTYSNDNGLLSISISEYDKTELTLTNAGLEYRVVHYSLSEPHQTSALIFNDGSMLGLVSFMEHLGAFDAAFENMN